MITVVELCHQQMSRVMHLITMYACHSCTIWKEVNITSKTTKAKKKQLYKPQFSFPQKKYYKYQYKAIWTQSLTYSQSEQQINQYCDSLFNECIRKTRTDVLACVKISLMNPQPTQLPSITMSVEGKKHLFLVDTNSLYAIIHEDLVTSPYLHCEPSMVQRWP